MRLLLLCCFVLCVPFISSANQIDQFLNSRTVIGQIYFDQGSAQLSGKYKKMLKELAKGLEQHNEPGRLVRVEGYASPEGHALFNYNLSVQRALTIKNQLKEYGVEAQLFFTGFGEKQSTAAKLAMQRRVDLATYNVNPEVKQLFDGSGHVERFVAR